MAQNSVTTSGKKGSNSFWLHLFFPMTYIARSLTENAMRTIIRVPEKRQEGDKELSQGIKQRELIRKMY